MTEMWMVRAGENAFLIDVFKENGLVAIGWGLGDLKNKLKKDIEDLANGKYPNKTKNQKSAIVSQEYRFCREIKQNDYVLSYDSSTRKYILGKIKSDYYYPDIISRNLDDDDYSDVRDVEWLGEIPRDNLNVSTKKYFGSHFNIVQH